MNEQSLASLISNMTSYKTMDVEQLRQTMEVALAILLAEQQKREYLYQAYTPLLVQVNCFELKAGDCLAFVCNTCGGYDGFWHVAPETFDAISESIIHRLRHQGSVRLLVPNVRSIKLSCDCDKTNKETNNVNK